MTAALVNPTPAQLMRVMLEPVPLRASDDPRERKAPVHHNWQHTLYNPSDWQPGQGIGLRCGLQTDGSYLYTLDFDHKPEEGQHAPNNFALFLSKLPDHIRDTLFTAFSTSWSGRYAMFRCLTKYSKTWLRDDRGRKTGDFLGEGSQVVMPTVDRWIQGRLTDIPVFESADDVALILRACGYRAPTEETATTINWNTIASSPTTKLLNGIPARLDPNCTAARVLRNEEPVRDTSHARFIVATDLIRHGYSDDDTASLLFTLCDYGTSARKGDRWVQRDIARIIGKVRTQQPHAHGVMEQGELVKADGGRPRSATLEQYLFYLRQNLTGPDHVMKTQAEIAADLGISRRTVQRIEAQGKAAGLFSRQIAASGRDSFLILTCAKTPAVNGEGGTIGGLGVNSLDPSTCEQGGCGGDEVLAHVCWACGKAATEDGAGIIRCTACGEVPVVARLVAEALDAYDGLRHGKRRTALIVAYVHSNGRPDASDEWITELCDGLRVDRSSRQADERLIAELKTLTDKQVKTRIRSSSGRSKEAHDNGNTAQAWVFGRRAWFCQREMDSRQTPERTERLNAIKGMLGHRDAVNQMMMGSM